MTKYNVDVVDMTGECNSYLAVSVTENTHTLWLIGDNGAITKWQLRNVIRYTLYPIQPK